MDVLQIIMVVFMVGALGAVVVGVIAMAVNGKLNKNHSNKLMRLRVLFQAIAVLSLCYYYLGIKELSQIYPLEKIIFF